ncbi:oxidoreductase [Mycolicibacterium murale]|uniref:Oxidoreductase n=1 Tax=Mycolicibacterium murale TaxID=182220 RepID=A0A7I9WNJ2_9MYCO|nr:FAD-dependent monooxygenase [Mycolicibacterium murale]MCV7184404.1 FAD-dependent monooxygenase [Mycolicibacterium murale]GFG59294.1 oxidoreductase [Mycolicibacterium murale]
MRVLVSGAGIAGLACAIEFGARGDDVTVVERGGGLRTSGTPVDIRGDAVEAVSDLGLLARLQARRVRMSENTRFVDRYGVPVAPIPIDEVNETADDFEILRGDLVQTLADAVADRVDLRFDQWITHLTDEGDVTFCTGEDGRYDLVIGADGQHSTVRRQMFGPDRDHVRHLGVYFALAHLGGADEEVNSVYNVPGRLVGTFRYGGATMVNFQFRSQELVYDHRDVDAQKQLLIAAFAGHDSWRIPELLEAARADPDFYFTSASQVHLPTWRRGRVVLVGDAGYCPAFLSGRGTSLALLGARLLAQEWHRDADPTRALANYEARQRPYVVAAQAAVHAGADRLLPPTWAAIAARNTALQQR